MEEEEGVDEVLHGSGMDGIGGEEPASVAVTESSDGFLVVAVVRVIFVLFRAFFRPWFGCSLCSFFRALSITPGRGCQTRARHTPGQQN